MKDQIVFEEDIEGGPAQQNKMPQRKMSYLISWGIARDERGANTILFGVVILSVLISLMLLRLGSTVGNRYGNYDEMRITHPELFKNNPPPVR